MNTTQSQRLEQYCGSNTVIPNPQKPLPAMEGWRNLLTATTFTCSPVSFTTNVAHTLGKEIN